MTQLTTFGTGFTNGIPLDLSLLDIAPTQGAVVGQNIRVGASGDFELYDVLDSSAYSNTLPNNITTVQGLADYIENNLVKPEVAKIRINSNDNAINYNITTSTVVQFSEIAENPGVNGDLTVSGNTIIVNKARVITVMAGLPLFSSATDARVSLEARVAINGNIIDAASYSYIRGGAGTNNPHLRDDITVLFCGTVNAGDVIDLRLRRAAGSQTATACTIQLGGYFAVRT